LVQCREAKRGLNDGPLLGAAGKKEGGGTVLWQALELSLGTEFAFRP